MASRLWPGYLWSVPDNDGIYLTFDDGPIPEITPWVMDELDKIGGKATFFCIGNNIRKHPEIFKQLLDRGHRIGNHTYSHLNGRESSLEGYLENTARAQAEIEIHHSGGHLLFRPPYGLIKKQQGRHLIGLGYQIVMWDLLSGDFDHKQSPEYCWNQVKKHLTPGSIVVMHDSQKAKEKLEYILPRTLDYIEKKGWKCRSIN